MRHLRFKEMMALQNYNHFKRDEVEDNNKKKPNLGTGIVF
jgi:hypothetical protein